jgi:hypothetical protein
MIKLIFELSINNGRRHVNLLNGIFKRIRTSLIKTLLILKGSMDIIYLGENPVKKITALIDKG